MKKSLAFLLTFSLVANSIQAEESAREIVQKMDELMRGSTMVGKYTMTVKRPKWQRKMSFDFWSEGTEKSFIRMQSPAKNRGVTFLKIGREMWNYVPKINKVIKVPPSMMLQSWMGSDFTNDDLVKESSIVKDYWHTYLNRDIFEKQEVHVIELRPKPEAAVVWDKIIEWVRISDFIPVKAEFFNERGEKVRTMLYTDVKRMGDRTIPTVFTLIEDKKPGHETSMILEEGEFDVKIRNSVFTKQNLRKSK